MKIILYNFFLHSSYILVTLFFRNFSDIFFYFLLKIFIMMQLISLLVFRIIISLHQADIAVSNRSIANV